MPAQIGGPPPSKETAVNLLEFANRQITAATKILRKFFFKVVFSFSIE